LTRPTPTTVDLAASQNLQQTAESRSVLIESGRRRQLHHYGNLTNAGGIAGAALRNARDRVWSEVVNAQVRSGMVRRLRKDNTGLTPGGLVCRQRIKIASSPPPRLRCIRIRRPADRNTCFRWSGRHASSAWCISIYAD
jgi:hypothetical protein